MTKFKKRKLSSPFLIGFFVFTSVVIIVTTIIWLGASHFLEENQEYVTYFDSSVQGLEIGSPVKYQGVPVGSISEIGLAPDGKLVQVVMDINKSLAVSDSMRIRAEMAGLTGAKFLEVNFPKDLKLANTNPILTFELNPQYRFIKSMPSGIQEIEIAFRDAMNKLMEIQTGEISQATLNFLGTTSDFFSDEKLHNIIAQLEESSIKINSVLGRADSSGIISNLSTTAFQLRKTVDVLKEFSENLKMKVTELDLKGKTEKTFALVDTTIIDTRKVINNLGLRSENVIYSINEILEDLKSTNKSLQKSIKAINTSPSQIFLSEPPGEEK